MCKTNALDKKGNQHGICNRNSSDLKKVCIGCVRETPRINIKAAWDV